MNAQDRSAAREATSGRLANFEDGDDETPISLPPRRTQKRPTVVNDGAGDPTTDQSDTTEPSPAPAVNPRVKAPHDRMQASNVHIPVDLLQPVKDKCARDGMSHGEVIIVAVENAHPRLAELINPAAKAGGTLFEARTVRPSTVAGAVTPLNYRLRQADFVVLDSLAQEFGSPSRGRLITVALTDYFDGRTAP